ncbi:hypothetical protein HHK36_028276 [Tetracentron sinense]|uniref:AAA+ ATPase domain-containing protein n=1 Tax=Tetracentron sinense TaxID=13715 RepID=A0A835D1X2_TETSI|nr:hypothetical protein HHK36_028276 [Tetracentron sinense]
MTDAVVQALVEKLLTTLLNESRFALEFQSQFEEMKIRLRLMRAFLADVYGLKKMHETVKENLNWLRELIYEADDILTDCQIQADYRKEGCNLYTLSPRKVFFRYNTRNKLKDINVRIGKMEDCLRSYLAPLPGQSNRRVVRWTSQAFEQSEIVGLTKDTRNIKGWILPTYEVLHRVGIVGMGGLGKTTIAQKIFNDEEVVARFKKRIWVSVSQTFSEAGIMRSMLKQLEEDSHQKLNLEEDESGAHGQLLKKIQRTLSNVNENGCADGQLLKKIRQELSNTTYLIVMDDVWSIDDGWWDRLCAGLPKMIGHSSTIIITTRNENVARSMGVEEARIHRPKILDHYASWLLFCKTAFPASKGVPENPHLEELGNEILKKCGGLPLAIRTIGGLLSSKTHSLGEWKRICDNFHDQLTTGECESSVIPSLHLSYDELPTHLKHCILCFSIYPEDYEINAEQLVHWWVGEGFIHRKSLKTAIEVAFDCLSELISRCLVEVHRSHYDGRVYSCKMHDMVRDLIIKIARDEAFCSFDEGGRQTTATNSRHLGLTSEMDMQPLERNSKLRALLLLPSCPIRFYKNTGLARVKSLRVLDLSQNNLDKICIEDLLHWIISLKRLAYLKLGGVSGLKEVPHSIRKLRNLHIFVLTECDDLQKLPQSITTLQKLTVLDVGYCPSLQCLPRGLGRLSNLQELSGYKLGSPSSMDGCRLSELTQLRVLRMNISEEGEISDDEMTVLSQFRKLKVLSIDYGNCVNKAILKKLVNISPPPHLQELYLVMYHEEATPNWINPTSLSELQYLCIQGGELRQMNSNFWGNNGNVWKLEGLCLMFLPRLQVEWKMVRSVMPFLRYLEISHCYMLDSFPCDVSNHGFWRKIEEEECKDGEMD